MMQNASTADVSRHELVEEIDKVMLLIQSLEIRSKYDNVKILTAALESLEFIKDELTNVSRETIQNEDGD